MKIEATNIQTSTFTQKNSTKVASSQKANIENQTKGIRLKDKEEDTKEEIAQSLAKGGKKTKITTTFTKGERKLQIPRLVKVKNSTASEASVDHVTITETGKTLQNATTHTDNNKKTDQTYQVLKKVTNKQDIIITAKRDYDYYVNENEDLAIKILDKASGETIKEIPTKEQQQLTKAVRENLERQFDIE